MALKPETIAKIQQKLHGLNEEEQQKKLQEIVKQLPPEEIKEFQKQNCPFCSIVSGNIESHAVFEDNLFMAILDINPANKGHIVLFPREHRYALFDMTDNEIGEMFKVANRLSNAVHDGIKSEGTNIFVAVGEVAGQRSGHVLVHIIPRFKDDGIDFTWNFKRLSKEEFKKVADNVKSNLKFDKLKSETIKKKTVKMKERQRIA